MLLAVDLGLLKPGLDSMLDSQQAALNGQVLVEPLPLIGSALAGQTSSQILASQIKPAIDAQLSPLLNPTSSQVRNALLSALGPSGLNVLVDKNNDNTVTVADIDLNDTSTDVRFSFRLLRSLTSVGSIALASNLGLPGMGFQVSGGSTSAWLGYGLNMAFGVDSSGFYFDTVAAEELRFQFQITTPGLTITAARFGLLGARLSDVAGTPTTMNGEYDVDLKDPGNDGRLRTAELSGDLLDARILGSANLHFDLSLNFRADPRFPSLTTRMDVAWPFAGTVVDPAQPQTLGNAPLVSFGNIVIRPGSFASDLIDDALGPLNSLLEPMRPVIEVLTTPVPVLSDLGIDITLLDIFGGDSSGLDFAAKASNIISQVSGLTSALQNVQLNVGAFDLRGEDVRDPAFNLAQAQPLMLQPLNTVRQGMYATLKPTGLLGYAAALNDVKPSGDPAITAQPVQIPLLAEPMQIYGLLLGAPADFFRVNLPAVSFNTGFSHTYPIFGPLVATFSGDLGLSIRPSFGFDSDGVYAFAQSGEPADLARGIYVGDGGAQEDPAELTLFASLAAGMALDFVLVSAGVEGGVHADVNFNLHDPTPDGKVHLGELDQGLCMFDVGGAFSAFLDAYITFGISPFSYTKTFNIDQTTLIDFTGGCHPDPVVLAERLPDGTLVLNMGPRASLRNVQESEANEQFRIRHISGSAGDETVAVCAFGVVQQIEHVSRIEADGGSGNDHITASPFELVTEGVDAGTYRVVPESDQTYLANQIPYNLVDLGDLADARVRSPVDFVGGAGSDLLVGGSNDDRLEGGPGGDVLLGGDGADQLLGGNDTTGDMLYGGAGPDLLDGGTGQNTASYRDSDAGVLIDLLQHTAHNGTAEGDQLINIQRLEGSNFGDVLAGDDTADTLEGFGGQDLLLGRGGNDVLNGGGDADALDGGTGDNGVSYYRSPAGVNVDLASNVVSGGEADGDSLVGEFRFAEGTESNDLLVGDSGNNLLIGFGGGNSLVGREGDDNLRGGSGVDWVVGGIGNDTIDTADSNDVILGDEGTILPSGVPSPLFSAQDGHDSIVAGGGDDLILGQGGNDTVDGGDGNDQVFGYDGNDSIVSGDGDDTVDGAQGADTLAAGPGRDSITGGPGPDQIDGGAGIDLVSYVNSPAAVLVNLASAIGSGGDAQGDVLSLVEDADGSAFDDTLVAVSSASEPNQPGSVLRGLGGNDMIVAGPLIRTLNGGLQIGDNLDGGAGVDTLSYINSTNGVFINLSTLSWGLNIHDGVYENNITLQPNSVFRGWAQGDFINGFENVIGSDFSDFIVGTDGDNVIDPRLASDDLNYEVNRYRMYRDGVEGLGGTDTLVIDYSRRDTGSGLANRAVPGFSGTFGEIRRFIAEGSDTVLDWASYNDIERYNITGTSRTDYIQGWGNDDTIHGMGGDDMIWARSGGGDLDGGTGADMLSADLSNLTVPVIFDSQIPFDLSTGAFHLSVRDFESFGTKPVRLPDIYLGPQYITATLSSADYQLRTGSGNDRLVFHGAYPDNVSLGPGDDSINPGLAPTFALYRYDWNTNSDPYVEYVSGDSGTDLLIEDWSLGDVGTGVFMNTDSGYHFPSGGFAGVVSRTVSTTNPTALDHVNAWSFERVNVTGTGRNDRLVGGLLDNTLIGGDGDDTLWGGTRGGEFNGGAGNDYLGVDLSAISVPINFNSAQTFIFSGPPVDVRIDNCEIFGSDYHSQFVLGSGNDSVILNGRYDDVIYSGPGSDTVNPGLGYDVVDPGNPGDGVNRVVLDYSLGDTGQGMQMFDPGQGWNLRAWRLNAAGTANLDQLQFFWNVSEFYVTGTTHNDSLLGLSGADRLIGVNPRTARPGLGEIDSMNGAAGADRYILGDAHSVYYDDGNATGDGSGDYARINLNPAEGDVIELRGSPSDYILAPASGGTGVYFRRSGQSNELIAVIPSPPAGFNLNGSYFAYVPAPVVQVSAESFNYVTAPQSLSFRFTGDVAASIDAADLRVTDLNTGLFIGVNTPNVSFDGTTTIATFTFSASTGASLHDGNYRATLLAAGITDPAGKAIDGDANGSSGGDHRFDFFFLSGDANYDRKVNIVDLSILAANWQQTQRTFAQGDFNYDGLVDAADLRILATNWQKSLEVVPLRWSITRVARLMPAPQQAPRQSGVEPLPGDLSDPHDGELFVL